MEDPEFLDLIDTPTDFAAFPEEDVCPDNAKLGIISQLDSPVHFSQYSRKADENIDTLDVVILLPHFREVSNISWSFDEDGAVFNLHFEWPKLEKETILKLKRHKNWEEYHPRWKALQRMMNTVVPTSGVQSIRLPFSVETDSSMVYDNYLSQPKSQTAANQSEPPDVYLIMNFLKKETEKPKQFIDQKKKII